MVVCVYGGAGYTGEVLWAHGKTVWDLGISVWNLGIRVWNLMFGA